MYSLCPVRLSCSLEKTSVDGIATKAGIGAEHGIETSPYISSWNLSAVMVMQKMLMGNAFFDQLVGDWGTSPPWTKCSRILTVSTSHFHGTTGRCLTRTGYFWTPPRTINHSKTGTTRLFCSWRERSGMYRATVKVFVRSWGSMLRRTWRKNQKPLP